MSTGLFGTPTSQPATGGLLGTPTQPTQQTGASTATPTLSGGLFNGSSATQPPATNGLLGAKPTLQSTSQSNGLFGGCYIEVIGGIMNILAATTNIPSTPSNSAGGISPSQPLYQSGLFGGSFTSSPTSFSSSANFTDLLTRADSLKSKVIPTNQQYSSNSKLVGNNDLRSIFRASDEIWKRKQLRSDSQWKPKDAITGASSKTNSVDQTSIATTPVDQSTSAAYDNYVKRSIERAKIEAERAFINQHILDQSNFTPDYGKHKIGKMVSDNTSIAIGSKNTNDIVMDIFASHVSKALDKSCSASIELAVSDALKEISDPDSTKLWNKVFALCEIKQPGDFGSVADFRGSDQWKSFVIEKSIVLLQQLFKEHMENVIQNNLQKAQRGGVPGVVSLIDAYLNVRLEPQFEYEDSRYGKHPIWPFIFICLRIGEFTLASKAASTHLQNITNNSVLVKILSSFNANQLIDGDRRFQLNAEWKHVTSTARDPYKRAVYAMILGHECPEVNTCIEDWLWSRLVNSQLDPVNGLGHFYKLQNTICADYGEDYFVNQTGNPTLYFTVLWLTGQIERAIDLLFRSDQRHHAMHIAILAYQKKLLNINKYSAAPILSYDSKDPIYCQFNFSRFVLLYVKHFELSNLDYTLTYCFFLHNLEFEQDGGLENGNIFEACISRICFISEKVDQILGRMSDTGDRVTGLIDRYSSEINIYKIIARVARDFDVSGDALTACRLYILSGHPNEALQICSKQLSTYLSTVYRGTTEKAKELEDVVFLGNWLEERYRQRPDSGLRETYLAELSILLKLCAFYTTASSYPIEAISIMKSINLLPFTNEELSGRVANFSNLPEQVRSVLPDVVVTVMETLATIYKDPNTSQAVRNLYRSYANIILLYVAQTNQRFPVQINSKLLKLQAILS
ncbi:Nuclear pore protein [Aphelenchoides bicaudatus]|nr:Nuclear pore protein [Aphelenchoides bicaudatus]